MIRLPALIFRQDRQAAYTAPPNGSTTRPSSSGSPSQRMNGTIRKHIASRKAVGTADEPS